MRGDVIEQVYRQLKVIGRVEQLDLFLHSAGGQTEIPWRLITLIRDYCSRFCVLIPSLSHSAATHLAMGADEIVMGALSELSPVDPTRSHPLLPKASEEQPPAPASVQDLRHCVEFVKREIGNDSPEALAQILAVLFDKVHPLAIGAIQQSYELSRLISRKALETHMDPEEDKERISSIVEALSNGFYSHSYRIGWKEARDMGLKVTCADIHSELWMALETLHEHYRAYFQVVRKLAAAEFARPLLWIDTSQHRCILEQRMETKGGQVTVGESIWLSTDWISEPDGATAGVETAEFASAAVE